MCRSHTEEGWRYSSQPAGFSLFRDLSKGLGAEPSAAGDRGRMTVFGSSTSLQRPRLLSCAVRETGYDWVTLAEISGVPDRKGVPDVAGWERLMRYYKALWTELAKG